MRTVLAIELPDEANEIDDRQDRLKRFVDEQVKVEGWRKKKDSAEVHLKNDPARTLLILTKNHKAGILVL